MNIYDAIMRAADLIEKNPHRFNFRSTDIPEEGHCGTPGCALGWIGAFLPEDKRLRVYGGFSGIPEIRFPSVGAVAESLGFGDAAGFYDLMNAMSPGRDWMHNAKDCAITLRLYAKKYHAQREEVVSWGDVVWQPRELA